MSALARTGPCKGFENIEPIARLEDHSSLIATVTDASELTTTLDAKSDLFKLIGVLCTSCNTSLTDVQSAQGELEAEQTAAQEAQKIAGTGRRKRKATQAAQAGNQRNSPTCSPCVNFQMFSALVSSTLKIHLSSIPIHHPSLPLPIFNTHTLALFSPAVPDWTLTWGVSHTERMGSGHGEGMDEPQAIM